MRSEKVTAMRPELGLDSQSGALSVEAFQNTVLRPILKFQNPVTLCILQSNKHFNLEESLLRGEQLSKAVKDFTSKNQQFRNQLIGMMIGLMTKAEFEYYLSEQQEFNKRIIQMQVVRFVDQLSRI